MKDTSGEAGPKILDPVCDMIVAIDEAREDGRTLEMDDREYAFCSPGCMKTFAKAPPELAGRRSSSTNRPQLREC